jgi:hypothetical protein
MVCGMIPILGSSTLALQLGSPAHAERQVLPLGFLRALVAGAAQTLKRPQALELRRAHLNGHPHPAAETLHHRDVGNLQAVTLEEVRLRHGATFRLICRIASLATVVGPSYFRPLYPPSPVKANRSGSATLWGRYHSAGVRRPVRIPSPACSPSSVGRAQAPQTSRALASYTRLRRCATRCCPARRRP